MCCCRWRRRPSKDEQPSQDKQTSSGHHCALQAVRKKFGASFHECGRARKAAAVSHQHASVEEHWGRSKGKKTKIQKKPTKKQKKNKSGPSRQTEPIPARFVVHKLIQRYHHLLSQLLKEVKQIKRHLD